MATQANQTQDSEDFAAAFQGADAPVVAQTEDEAFGIMPEDDSPSEDEAQVVDEAAESPVDTSGAESQTEGGEPGAAPSVVIDPMAGETGDVVGDEPTDPKDLQRQKSWEGRLKAKETELKAREDALKAGATGATGATGETSEPGETMAQEAAEPQVIEAIEGAVEAVESGEMTFDQAMATLSSDFGSDFAKMLGVLITSKASEIAGKMTDEKTGAVRSELDGVVGELVAEKEKAHYESISDMHPDFVEVAGSPEFKQYVENLADSDKEAAMRVIGNGSSRQINALLTAYKGASQEAPAAKVDVADESAMDAAEGVRSKGMRIPEKPAKADDYEAAWNELA